MCEDYVGVHVAWHADTKDCARTRRVLPCLLVFHTLNAFDCHSFTDWASEEQWFHTLRPRATNTTERAPDSTGILSEQLLLLRANPCMKKHLHTVTSILCIKGALITITDHWSPKQYRPIPSQGLFVLNLLILKNIINYVWNLKDGTLLGTNICLNTLET